MTRTNIDLDDELVAEAMARFGISTKKSVVEFALRRLLMSPKPEDVILAVAGTGWSGDLDALREGTVEKFR